jgi:hypothetical protein
MVKRDGEGVLCGVGDFFFDGVLNMFLRLCFQSCTKLKSEKKLPAKQNKLNRETPMSSRYRARVAGLDGPAESPCIEGIHHVHERDAEKKAFPAILCLVVLQILYVVFDLVEATERNEAYGVVAGFLMVAFGLGILVVTFHTIRKRHWKVSHNLGFELAEGLVYVGLGAGVTVARWNSRFVPHQ